jgi:chromosome segregation ATPase
MNTINELETALDTVRTYFQGVQHTLDALRDAGGAHDQRFDRLAADLTTLGQEVATFRQTFAEQQAVQSSEQAALSAAVQAQRDAQTAARDQQEQRLGELAQGLEAQQAAQSSEQAALSAALQTQRDAQTAAREQQEQRLGELAQGLEALHAGQERQAAFEHRLAALVEQFGKLDPIIRELHGEISAQHQRVTTLETAVVPQVLEHHAQRLDAAEQQTREYQQALVDLQQKLAQVESRSPAPAPSQRVLIGILVAIIALAALVVIKFNTP